MKCLSSTQTIKEHQKIVVIVELKWDTESIEYKWTMSATVTRVWFINKRRKSFYFYGWMKPRLNGACIVCILNESVAERKKKLWPMP